MFTSDYQVVRLLQTCGVFALLVLGGCGQVNESTPPAGGTAQASAAGEEVEGEELPQFRYDPSYPPRLPNNWVLGAIGALWVDSKDHVWIAQRPGQVQGAGERYGLQGFSECCYPAPPVMEFDPDGNLVQAWGPVHDMEGNLLGEQSWSEDVQWVRSEHGITVDEEHNTVWISDQYPPSHILKFTTDGKFLLRLGETEGENEGESNSDTKNFAGATGLFADPSANELFVGDGYRLRRVIVLDSETGAFKRMWGAYGNKPEGPIGGTPVETQEEDERFPIYPQRLSPAPPDFRDDPPNRSQQFATIHCLTMSRDRLLYVCDRVNNRIQVFRPDGTYVQEAVIAPRTRGWGAVHALAFSADPAQRFVYVADGANKKVWILRRSDLEILGSFGHGGRGGGELLVAHAIGVDSKGNVYVGDTVSGNRLQRFLYTGLGPPQTDVR